MIIRRQVMFSENEKESKEDKKKKYKTAKAAGGVMIGAGALQTATGYSDKIIKKLRPKNYEAFTKDCKVNKKLLRNNKIAGPLVAAAGIGTLALAKHKEKKQKKEDDSTKE